MSFSKPRGDAVTRHLFVGNAGPSVGQSEADLRAQFQLYGEVTGVVCPEGRSHVFISFATEEQAALAMRELEGSDAAVSQRKLVIKYAAVKEGQGTPPPAVFFRAEDTGVPGLALIPAFVSEEEEQALLAGVQDCEWDDLARRRVLHFGYRFEYITRNVNRHAPLGPLPPFLQTVKARIEALPGVEEGLDQVTVNEYPPGVGLSAHIDTHSAFTGAIVSLSLAGDTVMEFRKGDCRRQLLLPRRSLLVMAGESRYAWAHYIPHRKADLIAGEHVPRPARRLSFTFRKVRGFKCDCSFPECCDSQSSTLPPTRMAQKLGISETSDGGKCGRAIGSNSNVEDRPSGMEAEQNQSEASLEELERLHVHQVYDSIAPHFSSTRVAIWPKVRAFIEALPTGAILVDAGCGNGKYFTVRQDIAVIASDRSTGLVEQAWRKMHHLGTSERTVRDADLSAGSCSPGADVYIADGMKLAIRSASCDALVCVAVLHHISSPERRVRMLTELMRVVQPGGRALITVWAQEQQESKKLAKWLPINVNKGDGLNGRDTTTASQRCDDTTSAPSAAAPAADGGDYFVPWHLPFHRTEAAAVLRSTQEREIGPAANVGARGASRGVTGGGEINHEKGSVMFKRYYHLFREGEMTRLGQQVEGCRVVDEFFDASNWCLILQKDR